MNISPKLPPSPKTGRQTTGTGSPREAATQQPAWKKQRTSFLPARTSTATHVSGTTKFNTRPRQDEAPPDEPKSGSEATPPGTCIGKSGGDVASRIVYFMAQQDGQWRSAGEIRSHFDNALHPEVNATLAALREEEMLVTAQPMAPSKKLFYRLPTAPQKQDEPRVELQGWKAHSASILRNLAALPLGHAMTAKEMRQVLEKQISGYVDVGQLLNKLAGTGAVDRARAGSRSHYLYSLSDRERTRLDEARARDAEMTTSNEQPDAAVRAQILDHLTLHSDQWVSARQLKWQFPESPSGRVDSALRMLVNSKVIIDRRPHDHATTSVYRLRGPFDAQLANTTSDTTRSANIEPAALLSIPSRDTVWNDSEARILDCLAALRSDHVIQASEIRNLVPELPSGNLSYTLRRLSDVGAIVATRSVGKRLIDYRLSESSRAALAARPPTAPGSIEARPSASLTPSLSAWTSEQVGAAILAYLRNQGGQRRTPTQVIQHLSDAPPSMVHRELFKLLKSGVLDSQRASGASSVSSYGLRNAPNTTTSTTTEDQDRSTSPATAVIAHDI